MAGWKRFALAPPEVPGLDWVVLTAVLIGTTFAVLGTVPPGA